MFLRIILQSWNRTSGYALEDVLVSHYSEFMGQHGFHLHTRDIEKEKLLRPHRNLDLIQDKADVLVSRAVEEVDTLVGLINVKASLAERRTDDVSS